MLSHALSCSLRQYSFHSLKSLSKALHRLRRQRKQGSLGYPTSLLRQEKSALIRANSAERHNQSPNWAFRRNTMKKNGVVFNKKSLKAARELAKWASGMN
jgi:hypothetical protein